MGFRGARQGCAPLCLRRIGGRDAYGQREAKNGEMDKVTPLFYDTEGDVPYLSIGSIGAPRLAVSQGLGDDVLLRVDAETGEIVGLTVLTLASRFGSAQLPQSLPVEIDLRKLA